jgi:hypothetical protein
MVLGAAAVGDREGWHFQPVLWEYRQARVGLVVSGAVVVVKFQVTGEAKWLPDGSVAALIVAVYWVVGERGWLGVQTNVKVCAL